MSVLTATDTMPHLSENRLERLKFIDGFRAIAIMLVVFSHAVHLTPLHPWDDPIEISFLTNIVVGATPLFVFISGFLFYHVFYRRWDSWTFWKGKLKNVFVPYALMTFIVVIGGIVIGTRPRFAEAIPGFEPDSLYSLYGLALLTGSAPLPLWYLPFIAIMFSFSPLFIRYIEQPGIVRAAILFASLVLGLAINRPIFGVDKLQATLYFLFYYLIGIEFSLRREMLIRILEHRAAVIVTLALLLASAIGENAIQGYGYGYGAWFEARPLNVHYLEKITLILFCCAACLRIDLLNCGPMKYLAHISFGVFFVHSILLFFVKAIRPNGFMLTGSFLLDCLALGSVLMGASIAVVAAVKYRAGPWSKLLIGA